MWPTTAAAPAAAIARRAGRRASAASSTLAAPLVMSSDHHQHAERRAGRAQHVGRADVAAARHAHVDPGAAASRKANGTEPERVAEEDPRDHQLNRVSDAEADGGARRGRRLQGECEVSRVRGRRAGQRRAARIAPCEDRWLRKTTAPAIRAPRQRAGCAASRRAARTDRGGRRAVQSFRRASVRCALNGRSSGSKPNGSSRRSNSSCIACSDGTPLARARARSPRGGPAARKHAAARRARRRSGAIGKRRLQARPGHGIARAVLDLADEPHRQVHVRSTRPTARSRAEPADPRAARRSLGPSHRATATNQSPSARSRHRPAVSAPSATSPAHRDSILRTRSSAACVAWNFTCARAPMNWKVRT